MTQKIAQRLTTMQAVEDPTAAAQIEAKCYDTAKDAQDYERGRKRLKYAKALEASQRPSMSEPPTRRPSKMPAKEKSGGLGSSPGGEAAPQFRFREGFAEGARRYVERWRSPDVIGHG